MKNICDCDHRFRLGKPWYILNEFLSEDLLLLRLFKKWNIRCIIKTTKLLIRCFSFKSNLATLSGLLILYVAISKSILKYLYCFWLLYFLLLCLKGRIRDSPISNFKIFGNWFVHLNYIQISNARLILFTCQHWFLPALCLDVFTK